MPELWDFSGGTFEGEWAKHLDQGFKIVFTGKLDHV